MLLLALFACTNAPPRTFDDEGGARYATGSTSDDGGGGTDTGDTGDTGVVDDGVTPIITDVVAAFTAPDADDQVYIDLLVTYTDAQDDLEGGWLNFRWGTGTATGDLVRLTIVAGTDYDPASEAGMADGAVEAQVGPVDNTEVHTITAVSLQDAAGHQSEAWDVGEVSGR